MFVSFDYPIKQLGRKRHITVYLPDDYYQSECRYPVLYINDGQNAFFDRISFCGVSWGFLEYAQVNQLDVIMVAIPCAFEDFKRMDEYGPWLINEELSFQETQTEGLIIGGEGQIYIDWLMNDLKPYIDRRFLTDINDTGIVGSSMGGVISAYATLAYPEVFCKCAALSTAFWFYMEEFSELILEHEYSGDLKFYFDLGEFEGCGSEEIDEWYIETNNDMYDLLKDKIEHLEYHYFEGAHHNETEWRKRVPLFMEFFYGE